MSDGNVVNALSTSVVLAYNLTALVIDDVKVSCHDNDCC